MWNLRSLITDTLKVSFPICLLGKSTFSLCGCSTWCLVSTVVHDRFEPFSFPYLQHIGDFNFPRLADFGAAISGANKLQCQEVLEELDVSIMEHILIL